jgi:hypothetical protein
MCARPRRSPTGWPGCTRKLALVERFGVQLAFVLGAFALGVAFAEALGAASLGIAFGFGQIAFSVALGYVLLRA